MARQSNIQTQLHITFDGDRFTYQVGEFIFSAHGESVEGPDKGPVNTEHRVRLALSLKTFGTLIATSYCNIHGLWETSLQIEMRV